METKKRHVRVVKKKNGREFQYTTINISTAETPLFRGNIARIQTQQILRSKQPSKSMTEVVIDAVAFYAEYLEKNNE